MIKAHGVDNLFRLVRVRNDMPEFTVCNICTHPGKFENALEVKEIRSNVRKFKHEKFTVWRCLNCGSLHSREAIDLDYYYVHYPIKNHIMNYATHKSYRNRLRLLQKHGLKKGHAILDFGCGQGLFVSFLLQCGYNASGYDSYVERYSDRKVLNVVYDVVTSYDVIEHAKQPVEFFEQLVCCIQRGGLLAVGTPAADKIDLSDPERFSMELHQPYHRHILSERALLNLGVHAGLDVIKVYHRFYFDTLYPMVNTRFLKTYVYCAGNFIDVVFEEPRLKCLFTSPQLLFYALAGYFFPPSGNITVFFRKRRPASR
ncbi:MAG: class I SAM-dependent methyltransferase [Candidatus Brocadia sp.]|nr:class I SAM-dependent methyltransferase [Candidatus Brocadia sp.]